MVRSKGEGHGGWCVCAMNRIRRMQTKQSPGSHEYRTEKGLEVTGVHNGVREEPALPTPPGNYSNCPETETNGANTAENRQKLKMGEVFPRCPNSEM